MTVKIAGLWELGWSAPITEYILWEFALREFIIDEWIMCPVSGIADKGVKEYPYISDVLEANPDLQVVFVDEKGTQPLSSFKHPENVLYVFGKVSQSSFITYFREGDLSLRVETPANLGTMWPHQIAAIILYDRMLKMR